MKNKTAVVIGAPCVGKSTILYELKKSQPGLKQFSVRLFTMQLLNGDTPLGKFLRESDVVKPKRYMPDSVVESIFAEFLKTVLPSDFLILEGFPINVEQYYGMCRQLDRVGRALDAVFVFEDDIENIQKRRLARRVCLVCELKNGAGLPIRADAEKCPHCGGELVCRSEDEDGFFSERYDSFRKEVDFLCKIVCSTKIHKIDIGKSNAFEIINEWSGYNE